MSHKAGHIIITALKTPTTASGKVPVYYYVAAALLVCFAIGYLVGGF